MTDFLAIMGLPLAACLVLTGIHAYLGLHVLEREVIFVDLALAQIAALGASVAILLEWPLDGRLAYGLSLGLAMAGALIFSFTRTRKVRVPQEAVIGITYAVSAALMILVLSRSGEGDEKIREALLGNILLIGWKDILKIALIYAAIGAFHYIFRGPFFMISRSAEEARQKGVSVRLWDFLFYATFAVVVTSSVKIAGVLLVFAFLIIPAAAAILFCDRPGPKLFFGWTFGAAASVLGTAASYIWDLPTTACLVAVFGFLLVLAALVKIFTLQSSR